MPQGFTLSAVVLSKNSQDEIGRCLDSLRGWADQIIIVDGASQDRTCAIAKNYGCEVYSHAFLGSFAAERNFGTQKATCQWVLQLDSDEVVTAGFKEQCSQVLASTGYNAFKFRRKNYFLGHGFTYGGWYHWSQHFFRRGFASYSGRVHEHMEVNGQTGYMDADILHYPFASISQFLSRQNRYTGLQADDMIDTLRPCKRQVMVNLTIKPLKLFRKIYLNKHGCKEGAYGFIFAVLFVFVHFLKWAKVWEKTRMTW